MTHEEKEAHRERRRLKKIRKDKMRQRQLLNADDPNAKRHKHKHKCTDETCKHRKHKKRRKHKKHHRIMEAHVDSPSIPLIKKESNAEEDDPEPIVRLPKHISQHFDERLKTNAVVVLNTNDCKINMERKRPVHVPFIKEEVLTEEEVTSSHTEDSSSSSYVSSHVSTANVRYLKEIYSDSRIPAAIFLIPKPLRKVVGLLHSYQHANSGHGRAKAIEGMLRKGLATRNCSTRAFSEAKN